MIVLRRIDVAVSTFSGIYTNYEEFFRKMEHRWRKMWIKLLFGRNFAQVSGLLPLFLNLFAEREGAFFQKANALIRFYLHPNHPNTLETLVDYLSHGKCENMESIVYSFSQFFNFLWFLCNPTEYFFLLYNRNKFNLKILIL